METNLRAGEEYNERFLRRLRERFDRVEVDIPKVEVRFEHLSIEGDAYLGTRALPTLPNSVLNVIELQTAGRRLKSFPSPPPLSPCRRLLTSAEGKIVYQGPREDVLKFFVSVGFRCPERKGVADFLQEVSSMKDQEQYWYRNNEPYQYTTAAEFAELFSSFQVGQKLSDDLAVPFDKSTIHPAALVTDKCGISNSDIFKACLSREWLLIKRSSFLYIFKTTQITIMSIIALTVFFRTEMKSGQLLDASKFYGALFFSLLSLMFNGLSELALIFWVSHYIMISYYTSTNMKIPRKLAKKPTS